jgi:hypothetical protein
MVELWSFAAYMAAGVASTMRELGFEVETC